MATVAEKQTTQKEAENHAEVMARSSKFVQDYDGKYGQSFERFMRDFRELRSDVVALVNRRSTLEHEVRQMELKREAVEKEAQTRLQTVEMGHRALVDRLSKKEIEFNNKLKEIEQREAATAKARHEYELLKASLERQVQGVNQIAAKK